MAPAGDIRALWALALVLKNIIISDQSCKMEAIIIIFFPPEIKKMA